VQAVLQASGKRSEYGSSSRSDLIATIVIYSALPLHTDLQCYDFTLRQCTRPNVIYHMRLCTRFGYFVCPGSGTTLAHGTQDLAMTIQAPLMYSP
jgi:hypothetical protein